MLYSCAVTRQSSDVFSLKVLGNRTEFQRVASILQDTVDFDIDVNASVFETNIRGIDGRFGLWGETHVQHLNCCFYIHCTSGHRSGGKGECPPQVNVCVCVFACSCGRSAVSPSLGKEGGNGAGARVALLRTAAEDGRGRRQEAAAWCVLAFQTL